MTFVLIKELAAWTRRRIRHIQLPTNITLLSCATHNEHISKSFYEATSVGVLKRLKMTTSGTASLR